jgi:hypothetical protein
LQQLGETLIDGESPFKPALRKLLVCCGENDRITFEAEANWLKALSSGPAAMA